MPTQTMGFPISILDALVSTELCKSKGDARRQIQQGAVRLGADRDQQVTDVGLELASETVLWKGKKNCFRLVAE